MKVLNSIKKQKKLFLFTLILHWVFLLGSINTLPHHLGISYMVSQINFFENFLVSLWMLRTMLPLIFSIIALLFILFNIEKINKISKFHIFFFLIFIFQMIGLYLNKDRFFCDNESNGCYIQLLYLPLQGIGAIMLFIICDYVKISNILKYFFWIMLTLLVLHLIIIIIPKIPDLAYLNFSKAFSEIDENIFNRANPRTTGISRTLAIINLFLILSFFHTNKFNFKNLLIIPILIFSIILIFIQSRGSLLCYFVSLIIFIFFLNNTNLKYKIKCLLVLIVFPIFLYFSVTNFIIQHNNNNEKINSRVFDTHSSGRIDLWTYSIKKNDYGKIFGYGTQGDRFLLNKFEKSKIYGYGNNSSNIFIYTLLSGGVISVIILLLFYFKLFNFFLKNRKKIFFKNNSLYFNFSIVCLIFLLVRSNFENSFGLFSLDFLIMYLSLTYIVSFFKISKN
jgi:hypothetical protein